MRGLYCALETAKWSIMLRITMSKSSSGAQKYYSEEYYSEGIEHAVNYYSEKEQVIGKWGGKAAERLGLTEEIKKKDFAALCDNINPETGKILTSRKDADRTVGYDFTFNASKSVSLAYAFASEEEKKAILAAFMQSVRDTMDEIETGMQARVRDNGKNENRETGNLAYGEFVHFTTRPVDGVPDPHLHSHCFVFNATYDDQDKKWKAGQFKQLKQDAPYYEAVFHSSLARKMQDLGYLIERTENGFELSGIDNHMIQKFSRRTQEIDEHARELGITDEKQKSQIGAKTREGKRTDLSPEKQKAEWETRISKSELLHLQNLRTISQDFTRAAENQESAKNAVQFSLDHHLERKSVASDKEILATAVKAAIGKAEIKEIKSAFHANSQVISVRDNLRTFITSKEAVKEEKQLIANANSLKNRFKPINPECRIENKQLNDQQQAATRHVLSTSDGIAVITGKAGVGKTTLMVEVKKGIEDSGKKIFSFAPSSEASRGVQRSEGFTNADTVASLIQNKAKHAELKNQVIWIDEAGQLSNRDMNKVIGIAKEQNARIILSGDTKQHSSVERGDALRILQKYGGIKSANVNRIQRQKNNDYRDAVKLFSDGDTEKGFKKLDSIGAVLEVPESLERVQAIAIDYYGSAYKNKEKKSDVLVVAPTHAEGEVVTGHIRKKLKDEGILGKDDREFTSLRNLQLTEAEKLQPENYKKGTWIVFHQNIKGIKAGTRLEVMGYEGENLLARNKLGLPFDVPIEQAKKFSVYEPRNISIAKGDKVRITNNGKACDGKNLFNGTCFHVQGFDKDGNIKLSNGSTISKDFGHINLGYVLTSHSSQGKTADKVIIAQSSSTFRASSLEQFYVSVSRGKQAVSIYTDDKEGLVHAISQSAQRISATELLQKSSRAADGGRVPVLSKIKDKAKETLEKFRKIQTNQNDIPGKNRTGIRKAK